MQIDRPDPVQESPRKAGQRFRAALKLVAGFVAVLWVILIVDAALDLGLRQYGVRPRTLSGLLGLLTMPLLHGGVVHLLHNTLGCLLLGTGLLFFYPETAWRVIPWFWVVPPALVWLIGQPGSIHYGASGLTFAMFAYLSLGGMLRRDAATLALSLAVLFYFGSMLSGILPVEPGISWEGHLGGILVGGLFGFIYRARDIPPRKRYDWEDDDDDDGDDFDDFEWPR